MKSPQDTAVARAQDYVRDRGWRQDPLTWQELEVLVELTFGPDLQDYQTGYDDGYAEGQSYSAFELDREDVLDWCADHGYRLVKEQAS